MFTEYANSLAGLAIEMLAIVVMALGAVAITKVKTYISTNTELKNNVLAQQLVDSFVAHAEKEFKGVSGVQKRDYVLSKVSESLTQRGIKVNSEEILASIERGVNATKTK